MNFSVLPALHMLPVWRVPVLAVATYVICVLSLYRDTAASMVAIWLRSETYTHAFVVPPIALWLVWRQRAALARLQPQPQAWVLLPILALAALWWVADRAVVNAAAQFALVGLLVLSVPALLGLAVARSILFPLAFLFFAVPFGEFLTPLMMQYTADFTVAALRLSGIPVYREGQQFVIPSGHWSVVEACSGVRYLMASFMVGTLFAYLNYRSLRRRLAFVVVSLTVPVVANWVRAYIIVMLGHVSNNTIATGVDHIVYGWVFFGVVITLMFLIGARWAEVDEPVAEGAMAASSNAGAASMWPFVAMASFAVLATAWPLNLGLPAKTAARGAPQWSWPVQLSGGWARQETTPADWQPSFQGAVLAQSAHYGAGVQRVAVHVAYYRDQSADRKLISSVNVLVPSQSADWNLLTQSAYRIDAPGVPATWTRASITSTSGIATSLPGARQRLTVRQIYWVGGRWVRRDAEAKLWQAWSQLRGEPDDSAALTLSTSDADDGVADRTLDAFIAANFDALQQALLQARDR